MSPRTPEPETPAVDVLAADDPALLALAQHLRYLVLVGDMKREPEGVDHARRLVADARDDAGANFVAFAGPRLVGAVRINVVADGALDDLVSEYQLARIGPDFAARTGVVTRLVTRGGEADESETPARGGSAVLTRLVGALLGVVETRKLRWVAIRAEGPLAAFYRSMGFQHHADGGATDEGVAREVLVFDVEDPRHAAKATLAGWLYPKLFAR